MNQNDGPAGAVDYEMKACAVNGNEFREGFGILMSNAGSDVRSFESAGDVHKSLSTRTPRVIRRLRRLNRVSAAKREMFALLQWGGDGTTKPFLTVGLLPRLFRRR